MFRVFFMVLDFLWLPLLWSLQCLLMQLGHTAAFLSLRAPILFQQLPFAKEIA